MPKSNLTREECECLSNLWDEGMQNVVRQDLIEKAVRNTGLEEKTIRNWIGNEKKRKGMAIKRGTRSHKPENYLPGKMRKRSAYSTFKSEFLASDVAKKMKEDGASSGEIQTQGNVAYHQLSLESKNNYAELAGPAQEVCVPKEKIIRRIINNIDSNMKQLEEFGCPSIWLGYGGKVPERLFSAQMAELAEDDVFTNYIVSAMVNKLARLQMEQISETDARVHGKKTSKRREKKRKRGEKHVEQPKRNEDQRIKQKPGPSECDTNKDHTVSTGSVQSYVVSEGDDVNIISASGRKVGFGTVTNQAAVHGRELTYGWIPVMVVDVLPDVVPWDEFPTHSGLVEKNSFVAWPKSHLQPKT